MLQYEELSDLHCFLHLPNHETSQYMKLDLDCAVKVPIYQLSSLNTTSTRL